MQLVVHSRNGSRINRAWGLALRERFCRKFNFELQAAATEDNIVLSLTTAHSFELADVARYLNSASVRPLLIQAMLDAPMFITRWRWVGGVSLALPRFRGGRKVAPQLARMAAEDLIGTVFPDQIACAENLVGEPAVPAHPLVRQTISDCLHEAMDIEGLERLLAGLEAGGIRIVARDLTEPSPLALEVLSARPYAYLDDAPLEERRTQAVMSRRWLSPEAASDLGRLDPEAIARVRGEAWPEAANADELHDALVWLGFLGMDEARAGPGWSDWLSDLARAKRATRLHTPDATLWIAAERLPQFRALWPVAKLEPAIAAPAGAVGADCSREEALVEILRGRLEGLGPVTREALTAALGLAPNEIAAALAALEAEGFAMRGRFTPAAGEEWCERRLLARIHGYTVKRLRAEIEPVAARDFLRFLLTWQRVAADARMQGPDAVDTVVAQLEGFEAPAAAWESERRPLAGGRRRRRTAKFGLEEAGRWALSRRPRPAKSVPSAHAASEHVEHVARTLLLRYGVVFWRLIEREAAWLPPWRDLLRVYRRLESRGDIRGGRFVAGFSGEQFALPDAIGMLREVRRQPGAGALISLSGADPLNLVGILTPGPKLPALTGNRLLYRDGLPIALLAAGAVQFLETLDPASEWEAHKALLRCAEPAPSSVSEEALRGRSDIVIRAPHRPARPS